MNLFLAHAGHAHENIIQTKDQLLVWPLAAAIATVVVTAAMVAVVAVLSSKISTPGDKE